MSKQQLGATGIIFMALLVATAVSIGYAQKAREEMQTLEMNLVASSKITKNLRAQINDFKSDVKENEDFVKEYEQKIEAYRKELQQTQKVTQNQQKQIVDLKKTEKKLREYRTNFRDRIVALEAENSKLQQGVQLPQEQTTPKPKMLTEGETASDEEELLKTFEGMSMSQIQKEYKQFNKQIVRLADELMVTKQKLEEAEGQRKRDYKSEKDRMASSRERDKAQLDREINALERRAAKLRKEQREAKRVKSASQKEKERATRVLSEVNIARQEMMDDVANMHYNLGVIFTERSDFKKAIHEYKSSLKINPDDADAHYNIAILYDDVYKNSELALAHYRAYLRLRPDAPDAQQIRKIVIDKKSEIKVRDLGPKI